MSKTMASPTVDAVRGVSEFCVDLGVQYSNGSRYPAALEPEIRLMLMILEDALQCYQRYYAARHVLGQREFRDSKRWIFGPDEDWIYSFNHICACIDIDPEYLRKGLRQWHKTACQISGGGDLPNDRRCTRKFSIRPHDAPL